MTPAPAAPASLAERARAAAEGRTRTSDPAWSDIRWAGAARRCAARLAAILDLPADRLVTEASAARRYGGWPWPELTVTDGEHTFRFVAVDCDPDQLTALEPCPFCDGEVPTFPIRTLADLGDLITGGSQDEPVDEFDQDPGHKPDCLHAAPAA